MTIEAREIRCSENPAGDRLMTMLARYPKFIHGEHLRHRSFSFSVSSSRAIPVSKNLEEVRSDALRAAPVWWGREQKGMQSGEELSFVEMENAKLCWKQAAGYAVGMAEHMQAHNAHKSIVNRILEPFLHVNVLVTGTTAGWMNFFGLRLDRAAQPEIRTLAEAQWRVWNESRPQKLEPGQWHLPFIDGQTIASSKHKWDSGLDVITPSHIWDELTKISVARCARLSYLSFETNKRSTIEEDLALYDRLVGSSPIHASPAEHQATPDIICGQELIWVSDDAVEGIPFWKYKHQAGNLGPGWRQLRKMLPGEAVAPLPEGIRES